MASARFLDQRWFCLAAPLPALALGVLLMRRHTVPSAVWGKISPQGCSFWSSVLASWSYRLYLPGDAGGVRSPFQRSACCWPPLLTLVWRGSPLGTGGTSPPARRRALPTCSDPRVGESSGFPGGALAGWLAPLWGVGVTCLLALQPDAAQATAFAGALLTLLFFYRSPLRVIWPARLAVVICAAWAWMRQIVRGTVVPCDQPLRWALSSR